MRSSTPSASRRIVATSRACTRASSPGSSPPSATRGQFLVDRSQHVGRASLRRVVDLQVEQQRVALVERVTERAQVGRHARDRTVPLDEPALQPAGVPAAQHLGEGDDRQVCGEVRQRVRNAVSHSQGWRRSQRIVLVTAPLVGGHRLGEAGSRRDVPGRDRPEVSLDHAHRLVGVEVTGQAEDRVARGVVGGEEGGRVVEGRGFQFGEVPVAVVGVGERAERDRGKRDPREPAVGAIEHVDADLLLHDGDLVLQVLLRDARGAHPVGLEEQGELQRPGREQLEVVRVVGMRAAVECAAGALDVLRVLGLADVLAALEHQVLEEVGEPRPPLRLAAKPHVVVDAHAHDGGRLVGSQHDPKPVAQRDPFDRVGERTDLGLRARHGADASRESPRRPAASSVAGQPAGPVPGGPPSRPGARAAAAGRVSAMTAAALAVRR